ncbi:MAG: hypothetical protein ACI9ES_001720 [Oceanospirillaceae bacterium]|jgi:hypothetical protein
MSTSSFVPNSGPVSPESAKDPLTKMIEIAKDPDLSAEDKATLIAYAQKKFNNRRRMAYIALLTIVVSLVLLFIAAFMDGTSACVKSGDCIGILESIKANESLITWIEGFLTSIVAAYFGVSAWRPAS